MSEVVLFIGLLLGNLTVTSYRSVPNQTDSSPFHTATGEKVHRGGVAVSRDLLTRWGGPINYGDYIFVEGHGFLRVNDCMSSTKWDKRLKKRIPIVKSIDIWVESYEEEAKINVQRRNVYLMTRRLQSEKL